jgi:4a-hydroxytetrahydrobiopterin dehydratase
MSLADRDCRPLPAGSPPLSADGAAALLPEVPGWTREGERLVRRYRFPDFAAALRFVNEVGAVAERARHHPDILLHGWNRVEVATWTHSVGGLSENDFILAARLDRLPGGAGPAAGS